MSKVRSNCPDSSQKKDIKHSSLSPPNTVRFLDRNISWSLEACRHQQLAKQLAKLRPNPTLLWRQTALIPLLLLVVDAEVCRNLHGAGDTLGDVAKGAVAEDRTARATWCGQLATMTCKQGMRLQSWLAETFLKSTKSQNFDHGNATCVPTNINLHLQCDRRLTCSKPQSSCPRLEQPIPSTSWPILGVPWMHNHIRSARPEFVTSCDRSLIASLMEQKITPASQARTASKHNMSKQLEYANNLLHMAISQPEKPKASKNQSIVTEAEVSGWQVWLILTSTFMIV